MMKLTKEEQIQAIYDLKVGYTLGHADIAILKAMARQLLTGLEQEPVAWISDKDKCDPDVFERGVTACVLDVSKNEAETICRGLSSATGCKVDWHFVGGRVHIKALYAAPRLPQPAVGDGRDQFEEWFKFHHGDEHSIVKLHRANGGANYRDPHVDLAWIAWKDSRAAMLKGGRDVE